MEQHPQGSRLVIGIGNSLRGDDGVGALLAELEAVIPAGAGAPDSHRLEPAQLLAISQALYGRAPAACLLQVGPPEKVNSGSASTKKGTCLSPQPDRYAVAI